MDCQLSRAIFTRIEIFAKIPLRRSQYTHTLTNFCIRVKIALDSCYSKGYLIISLNKIKFATRFVTVIVTFVTITVTNVGGSALSEGRASNKTSVKQ